MSETLFEQYALKNGVASKGGTIVALEQSPVNNNDGTFEACAINAAGVAYMVTFADTAESVAIFYVTGVTKSKIYSEPLSILKR